MSSCCLRGSAGLCPRWNNERGPRFRRLDGFWGSDHGERRSEQREWWSQLGQRWSEQWEWWSQLGQRGSEQWEWWSQLGQRWSG